MAEKKRSGRDAMILERADMHALFDALTEGGYDLIGPTVRDNAVVYGPIGSVEDLPAGRSETAEAGRYRMTENKRQTLFGFSVAANTLRTFLQPSSVTLFEATREGSGFKAVASESDPPPRALIGVRACDLAALAIHDKIFIQGPYVDSRYQSARERLFIVAVNCTQPGGTCFCSSMGTGPRATGGFDLALTEVVQAKQHYFLVEPGSEAGREIAERLPLRKPAPAEIETADKQVDSAAARMGRTLKTDKIEAALYQRFDDPHWERVAERCLSCGNCTMVCPTCFCTNVEDSNDLSLQHAIRRKRWDSCFTVDFSYIHGGSIRSSGSSRYRQWLMHKLAYWMEQFGTSGCVGCGRCIIWCPVGIDITEEAARLTEVAK